MKILERKCPKCKVKVSKERFSMHLQKVHGVDPKFICPYCSIYVPGDPIIKHIESCKMKPKYIGVVIKKGSKVIKIKSKSTKSIRYKSKYKEIKDKKRKVEKDKWYLDNKEKIDPIDFAVQGGAFEMNRRRH